jgi:hypothetical protein
MNIAVGMAVSRRYVDALLAFEADIESARLAELSTAQLLDTSPFPAKHGVSHHAIVSILPSSGSLQLL